MSNKAVSRLARAKKAALTKQVTEREERPSTQYLAAAQQFAQSARVFEDRHGAGYTHEERVRYRADVTGAIIAAAAYLEAWIDELYVDLWRMTQNDQRHPRRELTSLHRVWSNATDAEVLQRYQQALAVADGDRYQANREPYASADAVIRLREYLVEYTPKSVLKDEEGEMEKRLQALFSASSIAEADAPWFPDRCMGAGCAEWAVKVVQDFTDDFSKRMQLPIQPAIPREGVA
jgi:hypothetical protein